MSKKIFNIIIKGIFIIGYPFIVFFWFKNVLVLKFYPFLVNFYMLFAFGLSLKSNKCIIEKFARIKDKNLSDEKIYYCKKVTIVWCCFFIINGLIALMTAFLPAAVWLLYNGFISYILIGLLGLAEFIYRRKHHAK